MAGTIPPPPVYEKTSLPTTPPSLHPDETLPPPVSTPIATPRMVHRTPIIPPAVHPPHAIPHPGPISRSPEIVASVTATSTVGSYPHAPTAPP
ncbi:MAG TPA: hypothetical protein PLV85_06975, partial [Polyangiaceae bacterium]|nr:hypothetical protein [Polyangiaceae bacterium]